MPCGRKRWGTELFVVDRRIFRRFNQRLEVRYVVAGVEHIGISNDVSLTGFFVHATVIPAPEEALPITVSLPDGRRVTLEVSAARNQRNPLALGAEIPPGFAVTILRLDEAFVGYLNELERPSAITPAVSDSGTYAALSEVSCIKMNRSRRDPVFDHRGIIRALVVDDEEGGFVHVRTAFAAVEVGSYKLEWRRTPEAALDALFQKHHRICFVQSEMKTTSGLELFRQARAGGSSTIFFLLSPARDRALEVRAMEAGVADVLDLVTLDANHLERSIRNALLRESAANELHLMKSAIETMRFGMVIKDMDGKILFANEAMAEMAACPLEELIGKPARVLAPPDLWRDLADPEARQAKRWTRESTNVRKDGTSFRVELTSDLVTDPVGNPIGIVTRVEELTEGR
jgi:PAS domain S-box-containing protein